LLQLALELDNVEELLQNFNLGAESNDSFCSLVSKLNIMSLVIAIIKNTVDISDGASLFQMANLSFERSEIYLELMAFLIGQIKLVEKHVSNLVLHLGTLAEEVVQYSHVGILGGHQIQNK
jgi:hypothetical protein